MPVVVQALRRGLVDCVAVVRTTKVTARRSTLAVVAGLATACAADPPQLPGGSSAAGSGTSTTAAVATDGGGSDGADTTTTVAPGSTGTGGVDTGDTDTGSDSSTGEPVVVVCEGADGLCHTALPPWPVGSARIEAIGLGDLDEDGLTDAVVADDLANVLLLLEGQGDGTFAALGSVPTQGGNIDDIVVADLDGDGHVDVATANAGSSTVTVLLGAGDGTLSLLVMQDVPGSPRSITAGDLDENAIADVVVGVAGTPGISPLHGPSYDRAGANYPIGAGAIDTVATGHLGPDLVLDVVAASRAGDAVFVVPGAAAGGFTVPSAQAFPAGQAVGGHLADLDADGSVDLLTVSADAVQVRLGAEPGTIAPAVVGNYPATVGIREAAFGDLNADGRPEVIVVSNQTDDLGVLVNADGTSFAPMLRFDYAENLWDVELADLNADGALDAVAAARNANFLAVLLSAATSR